jgi:hypothetical protein
MREAVNAALKEMGERAASAAAEAALTGVAERDRALFEELSAMAGASAEGGGALAVEEMGRVAAELPLRDYYLLLFRVLQDALLGAAALRAAGAEAKGESDASGLGLGWLRQVLAVGEVLPVFGAVAERFAPLSAEHEGLARMQRLVRPGLEFELERVARAMALARADELRALFAADKAPPPSHATSLALRAATRALRGVRAESVDSAVAGKAVADALEFVGYFCAPQFEEGPLHHLVGAVLRGDAHGAGRAAVPITDRRANAHVRLDDDDKPASACSGKCAVQ